MNINTLLSKITLSFNQSAFMKKRDNLHFPLSLLMGAEEKVKKGWFANEPWQMCSGRDEVYI